MSPLFHMLSLVRPRYTKIEILNKTEYTNRHTEAQFIRYYKLEKTIYWEFQIHTMLLSPSITNP